MNKHDSNKAEPTYVIVDSPTGRLLRELFLAVLLLPVFVFLSGVFFFILFLVSVQHSCYRGWGRHRFSYYYRALCGLDSLAQAAGRCNREGTLASGEVIFFDSDPINALKAAADASRQILPDHLDDPLSLDAVEKFFRLYYWARGNYDTKGVLSLLAGNGAGKGQFQFRSAAKEFALIDSPTRPVIIPWARAGAALCDKLRQSDLVSQSWLVSKLSRVAQRYSVNVYPDEFRRLEENGGIELVQDSWWVLRDMSSDYSETVGLLRHDASGEVTHEIG